MENVDITEQALRDRKFTEYRPNNFAIKTKPYVYFCIELEHGAVFSCIELGEQDIRLNINTLAEVDIMLKFLDLK